MNDNFEFPNGQLAKQTYVSNERWTGGSTLTLDDIFEASALEAGTAERFHNLAGITQPFAFVARTQEGNYAKILVLANGGQVVQGSGTDKYIEVVVSYQSSPNVPYAGFDPSRNNNTTEGTRRAARVNATK